MTRAFVDTSVFFSACFSSRGASHAILQECLRGNVTLVISDVVLDEVRRNLTANPAGPRLVAVFQHFLGAVPFEVVQATKRQVQQAARYTALKDAPIVAAARRAKVDYLASLDRRHLVGVDVVARDSGLKLVLPEELLRAIREQTSSSGS